MVIPFQFLNVPKDEELQVSFVCTCTGCDKANLTPLKVRTCSHMLCGHCWQKSACNVGDEVNRCMICEKPTDLLCFKDYNQFLGYNFFNGNFLLGNSEAAQYITKFIKDEETKTKTLEALNKHEKNILECMVRHAGKKREERLERATVKKILKRFKGNDDQPSERKK